MRKIKVVQIGLGHDHAYPMFDSMLYQKDIFDVVGFAVPETEKKDFSELVKHYREIGIPFYENVEDALAIEGLDGAVIETEEENLTKCAIMAAERGLHIHMDKPGGLDADEFEKLIEIVKSKKLVFSTGYIYRFNPVVREAIDKIKSGELGEIYSIEAHMNCEHKPQKRQWLERFPGGMMFFLGCHLIDLVYQIQGEPEEVIPLNTSTGGDGVTALDYGMAVFKYKNGVSFVKSCANEPGGFARRQFVICGTKGTIEIRPLESRRLRDDVICYGWQSSKVREIMASGDWNADAEFVETDVFNRYNDIIKNFAEMVCDGKENPYDYDYERRLHKLILRACGKEI